MATQNGRKSAPLAEELLTEAYRFEFFQAVRLLERISRENARDNPEERKNPVGGDQDPGREIVRFRALQSLGFPPGPIAGLKERAGSRLEVDSESPGLEMVVSFMGLTGPSGVLPQHYTRLMIERIREKDNSLRDFFDIFNHRIVSLFYRAWEKYRFPTAYERQQLDDSGAGEDQFTTSLYSLIGFGTGGLRRRMEFDDELLLFYGGLFADNHRPAISLEKIIRDYFGLPVKILQFQGQWLHIAPDDRSELASRRFPEGRNCQLGTTAVLGEHIRDLQSKFRVRLGPVSYRTLRRLIPSGDTLRPLAQLVRSYVGSEFDFDIQVVVEAKEIPPIVLGAGRDRAPYLGWTTFVISRPMEDDFEEIVFVAEGV